MLILYSKVETFLNYVVFYGMYAISTITKQSYEEISRNLKNSLLKNSIISEMEYTINIDPILTTNSEIQNIVKDD